MRKLLLTTAAVAVAIAGAVAGEPSFGTFTDTRDGQTYKTVIMPDGMTWMAQNLNYKTPCGSWCYNDSLSYCKKYGRLYSWDAAMTACPAGYHVPSSISWKYMRNGGDIKYVANYLKARSGWNDHCDGDNDRPCISGNGTDDFGFSALPGGIRSFDGSFHNIGDKGYWWTATKLRDGFAESRSIGYRDDLYYTANKKSDVLSVRCVADRP